MPEAQFRIDMKGRFKKVYSFCCKPAVLTEAVRMRGCYKLHTVWNGVRRGCQRWRRFQSTPSGTLTCAADGGNQSHSYAGLVRAPGGDFYGTTGGWGNAVPPLAELSSRSPLQANSPHFTSSAQRNCTDGANPWGVLVEAKDRKLYGTTAAGGTHVCKTQRQEKIGCGTVFKSRPTGS